MIQKIKNAAFFLFVLILAGSFKKNAADATLIIQFRAYVHGVPLQLNKKYLNAFGESFEISRFRFYTGKIAPIYSDGRFKSKISSKYHLIDFSDSSSTRIELPVMAGLCEGIRFQLGVDSLDQNRGAQTGALDPVRGMFWTWNSGYVNLKIEGYSAASPQPAHVIEYHIGGYHYADNTVWKIKMNSTNDESFRVSKENKIILEVGIDLEYLFDGPFPLHIKENSTCTMPGKMARKISENFIGSFTGLTISPNP
ncbi:MAG TPA: MbnP family protein [Puia sp.]|jgi:hypothetical protein